MLLGKDRRDGYALKMRRLWSETLTLLALVFLIAYSYPAFVTPISDRAQNVIEIVQWICWLAFAIDLLIGIVTSENKSNYLKHHLLDIAAVLLPFLRPLRLMRVISFGGLAIQKIAVGRQFAITLKVGIASIFIAYVAAVQVTISERGIEGSNIKNFGDGIWWAVTTVTTVGYGDRFPVTTEGRLLAVLLMIAGISLVGVVTASVASWFVKMSQNEQEKE
jgi:voltage-gated potassium channel